MTTPNPRPSFPTEEKRFHPFAALRFLRKTLAVYLIPLVNVLFERNWPAFWTALRQDAILFALLCGVSWVILQCSSWQLDEAGVLHLRWKLLFKLDTTIRGEALAALTLERPALFRLGGATKITLYPTGQPQKHVIPLCLRRADARELADRLLPIETPTLHTPAGSERAALVLLGANGISTLALVALAIRQTRQLPLDAETLAFAHLGHLAAFAARWLPAGAAWLLTLATALFGASLARSFAQTVHYEVWHTATQIGSRGGWIDRFECRVRSAQISYADVRVSPAARVLKRWPVFVTAGCCTPELPLFVYRSGGEALFRELLPEFQMPPDVRADPTQRSLIFCTGRHSLCALRPALAGVCHRPARHDRDAARPHRFLLCAALRGRDGLHPGGHLAAGGQSDPAAAGGCLPALHLRLPPGPLPDGVPISLGGQCPAHQLDPDLPRAGAAQGAEHPAGGGGHDRAFSGTGITLKHPLSGALRQIIPLCRVATSPSGWRASFDRRENQEFKKKESP